MMTLSALQERLKIIPKEEWSKLFDLLPELEKPQEFGRMEGLEKSDDGTVSFPFSVPSGIVSKYLQVVHELDIIPAFDWGTRKEGREILNSRKEDYDKMDMITLCKLMTCIIRSDKFCDGLLVGRFEDGTMQRIIRALKNKNGT